MAYSFLLEGFDLFLEPLDFCQVELLGLGHELGQPGGELVPTELHLCL